MTAAGRGATARWPALVLVLALGAPACSSSGDAPPGPASSASAAASATPDLGPPVTLGQLTELAKFEGDFASSLHDGWHSPVVGGDLRFLFSRQRKLCLVGPATDPVLTATCSALPGIALHEAAIETDAPERITLIDAEPGGERASFLVVDPSADRLITASGADLAGDVEVAGAWANGDVTYVTGRNSPMHVHRSGTPAATMPFPGERPSNLVILAGHLWATTHDAARVPTLKAYPLSRGDKPLADPIDLGAMPVGFSLGTLRACRAGDTTHLWLTTQAKGTFDPEVSHHVLQLRAGKLAPMVKSPAAGKAGPIACTRDAVRMAERSTIDGSAALQIECTSAGCTSTPIPDRLLRLGMKVAPIGDRLLVIWTSAGALRAQIGRAEDLFPGDQGHVLLEGAEKAGVHGIFARDREAVIVFNVGQGMYAVSVSTDGRLRPVKPVVAPR